MTARWLAAAQALVGVVLPAVAAPAVQELTFDEVLRATQRSPSFSRFAADVQAAEAAVVTARTYPYNPAIEVEASERDGAAGATTDRVVAVAQQLELAGQRGKRWAVAEAARASAHGIFAQNRRELLAEAALAFAEAVSRRELLAVEQSEAELARSFAALVERRLEAGAATAVELALAQAGLARAERGLAVAEGLYSSAQAHLAEVAGVTQPLVAPIGDIPEVAAPPSLDQLLDRAVNARTDLMAADARIRAAEARVRLALAERSPDLTVTARFGREEGDDIVGVRVSLSLPLFDRNKGGIAEAEAAVVAAASELAVRELAVRREVTAAHGLLTATLEAHQLAERMGVTPLKEGLALLERAFNVGKIGAAELLLYQRELVEGRRQAIQARAQVWQAATELSLAAGEGFSGTRWIEKLEVEP